MKWIFFVILTCLFVQAFSQEKSKEKAAYDAAMDTLVVRAARTFVVTLENDKEYSGKLVQQLKETKMLGIVITELKGRLAKTISTNVINIANDVNERSEVILSYEPRYDSLLKDAQDRILRSSLVDSVFSRYLLNKIPVPNTPAGGINFNPPLDTPGNTLITPNTTNVGPRPEIVTDLPKTDTISPSVIENKPDSPEVKTVDSPVVENNQNGGDNARSIWHIYLLLYVVALVMWLLFIFPILRPNKKVVVHYFNDKEYKYVLPRMIKPSTSDIFVIGYVSLFKIWLFRRKKIIVEILNTKTKWIGTPGEPKEVELKADGLRGFYQFPLTYVPPLVWRKYINLVQRYAHLLPEEKDEIFPDYFIISLDAPLLPVYTTALKELGISILQAIPEDNYLIQVMNQGQLDALYFNKELDFIRLVKRYTAMDTGVIMHADRLQKWASAAEELVRFDVMLHEKVSVEFVVPLLRENRIEYENSSSRSLRITVAFNPRFLVQLAANRHVQAIYEYESPALQNDLTRNIIGIDYPEGASVALDEDGTGEIVGVADTGIDEQHPDLDGRIESVEGWGRVNNVTDKHGHGTHVSGSIVGNGSASQGKIKGMAPGAKVFFQSIMDADGLLTGLPDDLSRLFEQAYLKEARIHNNSWGSSFPFYNADATSIDRFVYNHEDMLIVIAGGNNGSGVDLRYVDKGYIDHYSVGAPAIAKNALVIGAARNGRNTGGFAKRLYREIWPEKYPDAPIGTEKVSGNTDALAAYSSRGPCEDGDRIKPDLVAPGTDILSLKSSIAPDERFDGLYKNKHYAYLGGSSMSAAIASGAAAIVRQFYKSTIQYKRPSAALVKATLMNGSKKLESYDPVLKQKPIPNVDQGYGMIDLAFTIPGESNPFKLYFSDMDNKSPKAIEVSRQSCKFLLQLNEKGWIRVCLAYTDIPGRFIQHELDLVVMDDASGEKWIGNAGKTVNWNERKDKANNVEIIRIDEARAGSYQIRVEGRRIHDGAQGFALVVTASDMTSKFIKM